MSAGIAAANSSRSGDFMSDAGKFEHVLRIMQMQRRVPMNVTTEFRSHMVENIQMSNPLREQSAVFEARFSRCREMLCFLACRVLGNPEQAHTVVRNCKITASRNPPTFEYEGAFRSWLARILIDEGLAMIHQQNSDMTNLATSPDRRNK
jgi:hypothetical protein